MPFSMATDLINICIGNNIQSFTLIGGEPTLHPDFFDIVNYIVDKNCNISIVTNGIVLKDKSFCEKLKNIGNEKIRLGISLKGSTNRDYKIHCGKNAFESVCQGIENCRENQLRFSLSYVLSSESITNIEIFAKQIRNRGIQERIGFSFCNDILLENEELLATNTLHPLEINKILNEKYESLNTILEGNFFIHQSLPLCMCNETILDKMAEKNQAKTTCHVHNRTGVVFDTDGAILLCNHLAGYGIGRYKNDYWDIKSFKDYWISEYLVGLNKKLVYLPSMECEQCDILPECRGGCCIQWFSHTFESYKSKYLSLTNK
jgi:radical SAM protein with 4Fe4S-binding SPASM domain